MLSMLGVIRPSLAGRSMMVLLQEDAGICIGLNIKRPRSGRDLKVRRSHEGAPLRRLARSFRWSAALTRRFEAKLHCCPDRVDRGISPGARRPDGKARRPKISGISEGGATQPAGMPRPGIMSRTMRSGH